MNKNYYISIKRSISNILIIGILSSQILISFACEDTASNDSSGLTGCTYNGKSLYEGPQGGCYYINSNGNKTYVDRSECDC